MADTVVTRFAPSPTGYLHIGGARTALFNWLYARHTGGKFLLRIEDTDRERSTEAAVERHPRWPDMARARLGRRAALPVRARRPPPRGGRGAAGRAATAYHCYATPARARRDDARGERAGRGPLQISTIGRWRDRDPKEAPAGVKPVGPPEGAARGRDRDRGPGAGPRRVARTSDLDDLIILRSDGTPTYNLAVVVDDHDMGITHVIRGVDHLTNAARQVQIYTAMGWDVPVFAHVPLIHGPDGAKLSKRHGALGVEAYRAMGYLPGGLAQLPRAARLEPRRRRDHLDRAGDRLVRHRRHQQGAGPARLRQARRRQQPLHPPGRATPSCSARIKDLLCRTSCPRWRPARSTSPRIRAAVGWDRLRSPRLPALKERAKTLLELHRRRRLSRRRAAAARSTTRPPSCSTRDGRAPARRSSLPQFEAATGLAAPPLWRPWFATFAEATGRSSARSPNRCVPR